MKVLIVHCTYKFKGGEDTVVSEEIKLLEAQGIEVQLLSFTNEGNQFVKLLMLPFNYFSYKKTRKAIAGFQPDVVHVHNLHFAASPAVLVAIRHAKLPVVMTLHNFRLVCPSAILYQNGKLFLDSINSKFPWKAIFQGVYKNSRLITFWLAFSVQLHKWIGTWKNVNRYIVLSEHARAIILQSSLNLPVKQVVIKPNFSYTPAPAHVKSVNLPYFLFVGRLTEEKGIKVLLQAFSIVNYKLKIAGDGPMTQEVMESSRESINIEYLEHLGKEDVNVLMANCTALIFPSSWYEGMPLTIIESFACGAPIIASKLGAMETMITDGVNGRHFKADDLHDLVRVLNEWMTLSNSEKNQFREAAYSTYQNNYTPQKNVEQLLRIYNSVSGINYEPPGRVYPLTDIKDSVYS